MASCIAPISKAFAKPLSHLLGKRTMTTEEWFEEVFGKLDDSDQEKMSIEDIFEAVERKMQLHEFMHEEFVAEAVSLREKLALMDKKNGKYRNKFLSLFTKKTRYAKTKKELNQTELLCEIAKYAREIAAENYRKKLREMWLKSTRGTFELNNNHPEEPPLDWETLLESASDTDFTSSGEEDNHDHASITDVDSLLESECDNEQMYFMDDNAEKTEDIVQEIPSISHMDAEGDVISENIDEMVINDHILAIQTSQEPACGEEEALSSMDSMKQRLSSMRSGIAPSDEDSLLLSQFVTAKEDDSFLAYFHDDEEEKNILAGRPSSKSSSSSSSSSSPKECASTVEVFTIAMSNRSLLDRVSSMQFKSSLADSNNDVSDEEWM